MLSPLKWNYPVTVVNLWAELSGTSCGWSPPCPGTCCSWDVCVRNKVYLMNSGYSVEFMANKWGMVLLLKESIGRKDDPFLLESLLNFLLPMTVEVADRSFVLVSFPWSNPQHFLLCSWAAASPLCISPAITWGGAFEALEIPLSPCCSFRNSWAAPLSSHPALSSSGASLETGTAPATSQEEKCVGQLSQTHPMDCPLEAQSWESTHWAVAIKNSS